MRDIRKKRCAEKNEKQLEAFFDGELSEKKVQADILQSAHLDVLRTLREEIRAWFSAKTLDENGNELELNVWQNIAPRLEKPVPWYDRVLLALKGFGENSFRPQYAAAIACAVLVLFVAQNEFASESPVQMVRDKTRTLSDQTESLASERVPLAAERAEKTLAPMLAKADLTPRSRSVSKLEESAPEFARSVDAEQEAEETESTGHLVLEYNPNRSPLAVRESTRRAYRNSLARYRKPKSSMSVMRVGGYETPSSGMRKPDSREESWAAKYGAPRMIDRNFVLGGLRTRGADIDYVESGSSFRIVPGRKQAGPPIIWVER